MKTLIVYYSLHGNSRLIAENLKSCLKAELLEIKTMGEEKRKGFPLYLLGGGQAVLKMKPPLKPYTINVDNCDLVIIGTPVWAGSPAPAIVSFLDKTKISGKKIALFCCHGGGMGKAMQKLKALLQGNTIVGEIDFLNPSKTDSAGLKQKIDAWVKTLGVNTKQ